MKELVLNSREKTNKIIFVFHGYGANKENLFPIGEAFSTKIGDAEVHIPDGVDVCDEGFGYQWFPFVGEDVEEWKKAFRTKETVLESYISGVIEKKQLDYKQVILTGFSQGGMLSLLLGLKLGVKAIVVFSGVLIDPEVSIASKDTKVLMTHGAMDNVVPISAMYTSEQTLKDRGVDVQTIICNNVAHGIDGQALYGAVDFLKTL